MDAKCDVLEEKRWGRTKARDKIIQKKKKLVYLHLLFSHYLAAKILRLNQLQ